MFTSVAKCLRPTRRGIVSVPRRDFVSKLREGLSPC